MRFTGLHFVLPVAFLALLLTSPVFADTVTLQFNGATPSGIGGGGVYPYFFSVNGITAVLLCDSYDNNITKGETWKAKESPFLQGIASSMFGPSMILDYKAAGLIFKSLLAGKISGTTANWAIWGLFSSKAAGMSQFTSRGAAGVDTQYLKLATSAPNSAFNGLLLYTPISGSQSMGGTPQEFIGAAPEPSTLMLLGTGLLGLAGTIRRKIANL